MNKSAIAGALSVLVLAGCASTQKGSAPEPTPPAAAAAPAMPMQPVRVAPGAGRKVVLNMTGAKTSVDAKDWSSFKEEFRATFAEHAKIAGISFAMQEGPAKPMGEAGTLVTVHVVDYRQVGIGARVFFGAMTGNAYINAKVAFQDLNNGAKFGDQAYSTETSALAGVFGQVTPQQVNQIAGGVFGEIKGR